MGHRPQPPLYTRKVCGTYYPRSGSRPPDRVVKTDPRLCVVTDVLFSRVREPPPNVGPDVLFSLALPVVPMLLGGPRDDRLVPTSKSSSEVTSRDPPTPTVTTPNTTPPTSSDNLVTVVDPKSLPNVIYNSKSV